MPSDTIDCTVICKRAFVKSLDYNYTILRCPSECVRFTKRKLDRVPNECILNSFLINLDTCFGEARYKNNSVRSTPLRSVYEKEMHGSPPENLQTGRANKRAGIPADERECQKHLTVFNSFAKEKV